MKQYIAVYKKLLQINLMQLFAYRMNFINSTISSLGWGLFAVIMMVLLTAKTKTVFGWTQNELLVLVGCVNIFLGIFRGMFAHNFETMAVLINTGQLDSLLVKPIDAQFLVSGTYTRFTGLFRSICSAIFVMYLLAHMQIHTTLLDVFLFCLLLFFGFLLMYAIWFLCMTTIIWFPQLTNIIGLVNAVDTSVRYPQEIVTQFNSVVFLFILPFTLVVAVPTKALLHTLTLYESAELVIISIVFFVASRFFWIFALRFYTSASS